MFLLVEEGAESESRAASATTAAAATAATATAAAAAASAMPCSVYMQEPANTGVSSKRIAFSCFEARAADNSNICPARIRNA